MKFLKLLYNQIRKHTLGIIMFFWATASVVTIFSALSGIAYRDDFVLHGANVQENGSTAINGFVDYDFEQLDLLVPTSFVSDIPKNPDVAQIYDATITEQQIGLTKSAQDIDRSPAPQKLLQQGSKQIVYVEPIVVPVPFPSSPALVDGEVVVQGWIYPGPPACDALDDINARFFDVLKPEYHTLKSNGTLQLMTENAYGCNGWSDNNALLVKTAAAEQYATISGNTAGLSALVVSTTKKQNFINTMVNFMDNTGFTGVELDFEGFGGWTEQTYLNYLLFLDELGTSLHNNDYKLMVDLPPISNETEQSYYHLKYSDFEDLPVDELTVMAYDYQYDNGGGSPIAPHDWVVNIIHRIQSEITDHSRLVIGIPAYGYQASCSGYDVSILTYDQAVTKPGFATAVRDPNSAEMMWQKSGICYVYQDDQSIELKRAVIEAEGIHSISIWHLGGGNKYGL